MGYLSDKNYVALESNTSLIFIFNIKEKNAAIIPYTFHLNRLCTHAGKSQNYWRFRVFYAKRKKQGARSTCLWCVV